MTSFSEPLPFDATIKALKNAVHPSLLDAQVGIVCGSGLSTLADSLRDVVLVPYDELPGFGNSTVAGHKSALAFGRLGDGDGISVVVMLGRFHPYEGHPLATVVYPIRVMAKLGVKHIIITNAAGSLNPEIPVGTIVVIRDHIALPNLTGPLNPLLGPRTSPNHARFVPLSDAYSIPLRRMAFMSADKMGWNRSWLAEGTYAWVSGPTYETPAEGRFLRAAGADVVGMSTVPEVVAARDEGMEVLVLSLATNAVVIPQTYRSIREEVDMLTSGQQVERPPTPTVSHEEVLHIGKEKAELMRLLVEDIVNSISQLNRT
ncbi:inosine guanosine and xanthosine phosphorylase family protein [Rickenella mellea]|uniref:Purine nucleoside phosphorylase n=1 Tax=Rickenella mellea TaxID=50990 RepID=A0A4Y7QLS0_9AGAM|nr:inosine guanosine and xanthosine phosphorylase family protein [Rickenella mellea]